jgi:two-component system chemotaxis sensor kinase CheA
VSETVGTNPLDKYRQTFQEEAREVLVGLEAALLELHENPGEQELVARAFRALHTLKGSGAMFGFDRLSAFAHHLETAYEEVRSGRLPVTSELIDLSLASVDQIKQMLTEADGRAVSPAAAEILARLRRLVGKEDTNTALKNQRRQEVNGAGEETPLPPADATPSAAAPEEVAASAWRIRFAPGPDLLRNGANPLLLLRELSQLGRLEVKANQDAVPPLAELDPERCYIAWEMVLTTAAAPEAIRDVFIFVENCCQLEIGREAALLPYPVPEASPAPAADRPPTPAAGAEADPPQAREEKRTTWGRRSYDSPDTASSIRVPAAKLDQFVNLVGELVTVQARLAEVAAGRDDPEVSAVAEEIERLTAALREGSMSIRMLPLRGTFERFRRLVYDLARELGKEVELSIEGAETELDKTVIDQLNDPLMHLIRNCMDHGIESPEERRARGKGSPATIRLAARHAGASVLIEVADDGRGIDAVAVRARAIERGLIAADAPLTEAEIVSLIQAPGFSTARQVTDVSGRGVGMDVVRRSTEALRGRLEMASRPGAGTCVTLRLPLTMAIIDGLLVRIEGCHYVLPLATTLECIEITRRDVEQAHGKHMANVRGELIPYIRLREYFHIETERPEREQIMVTETAAGRFGFVVDQVLGDHQTVIKNLNRFCRHSQAISGATILGNGTVALILDPHQLAQEAIGRVSLGPRAEGRAPRAHPPGIAA